jgi:serralysin
MALIRGNNLKNKLTGTQSSDTILGLGGDDLMYGNGGNDTMRGGGGNDVMFGGAGNDKLFGGAGIDYLEGGAGNDLLVGGKGTDNLKGGAGRDIFKFFVGDNSDDVKDYIHDFKSGVDKIYLSKAFGFENAQDVLDNIASSGGDSTIRESLDMADNGIDVEIVLLGIDDASQLTVNDIVLF